jgi:hypothetical protein
MGSRGNYRLPCWRLGGCAAAGVRDQQVAMHASFMKLLLKQCPGGGTQLKSGDVLVLLGGRPIGAGAEGFVRQQLHFVAKMILKPRLAILCAAELDPDSNIVQIVSPFRFCTSLNWCYDNTIYNNEHSADPMCWDFAVLEHKPVALDSVQLLVDGDGGDTVQLLLGLIYRHPYYDVWLLAQIIAGVCSFVL